MSTRAIFDLGATPLCARSLVVGLGAALVACSPGRSGEELGFATEGNESGATGGADTGGASSPGSGGGGDPGGDDTTEPGAADCDAERLWYVGFADTHCGRCHGIDGSAQAGFTWVTDLSALLDSGKLVPGDPEGSQLYRRIEAGEMPPAGEDPRPNAEQIARLAELIEVCLPDDRPPSDGCEPPTVVGYEAQLAAMLDDLTDLPAGDYPFIRYLTLTHLNDGGLCRPEIDDYRGALSKLVNSLSNQNTIVPPVPIDDASTIYRIDLRDYGWDEAAPGFTDRWEAAAAATPYAIVRGEQDAITLRELTGTEVPFLMADAFVDVAAQPPLYSVMLGLPDDLGGLEAQIGLDIADDLADLNGVTRAGILVSGVASQNRVLQRHVIGNGAFWRTFEFEDDSQAPQSILSSPLDFDENGGSIIFSLPNALHGYMVIDAAGNRIDEAPIELMIDPAGTDGRVRTGLSCFGCHQTIVEATDDVAPFVDNSADFDAADKATVATLYSAPSDFNTLQGNDTMAYHAALIEANVEPLAEFEQITTAVDRFEEDPITLEQAAAELGIAPDVLEYELPNLGPALEALRDGGTIKRGTWTGLFPETICALNLGQSDDGGC